MIALDRLKLSNGVGAIHILDSAVSRKIRSAELKCERNRVYENRPMSYEILEAPDHVFEAKYTVCKPCFCILCSEYHTISAKHLI